MGNKCTATRLVLSASLVAGLAFGAPRTGVADDLFSVEPSENEPVEVVAVNATTTPKSKASDSYMSGAVVEPQLGLYDVTYIDDCCYEQIAEQIPAIEASTASLKSGWYALLDNVELSETLVVEGDAHIVLTGDYTLSVPKGIRVKKDGRLTLRTQGGSAANVLVRKGVLRELTEEQKLEEEQMIEHEREADPEYRFKEPQILFVEPCYEVVAGDNEPSTDPNHVFDPDHDPKPIGKPVLAKELLNKDYLVIHPCASHSLAVHDGEYVLSDGYYSCDRCGAWFDSVDARYVVARTDEEKAALKAELKTESVEESEGAAVVPESENEIVTITFDANGGSGTMDPLEVVAGQSFVLPECTFEAPKGMEFSQWSLGKPGSEVTATDSTTIRAWWKVATNTDEDSQSTDSTDNQDVSGNQNTTDGQNTAPSSQSSSVVNATQQGASTSQGGSPSTGDPFISSDIIGFMLTMGAAAVATGRQIRRK